MPKPPPGKPYSNLPETCFLQYSSHWLPQTASQIITIDKAITLDGNGHTLTSTAARAINVSGADGATIKNLTVTTTGERAINVIQNATNLTLDNVTATAANYAVNLAGSAANAKVTVTLPVGDAFANGETVEVYHDGQFVTYATVENGNISYEVSHFCEVTVQAKEEVVLDNVIDSVKEFVAFAEAVNAGNNYAKQTVTLGADLDLAGVTWTPIGTSNNPFKVGRFTFSNAATTSSTVTS